MRSSSLLWIRTCPDPCGVAGCRDGRNHIAERQRKLGGKFWDQDEFWKRDCTGFRAIVELLAFALIEVRPDYVAI